jgi:hypothetical protein
MTPNASYESMLSVKTTNNDDGACELERGNTYLATGFVDLIDQATGEVAQVPLHMARNPGWYFQKAGEMRRQPVKVSHKEFARELVRGNEGLDFEELWALGEAEDWFACESRPATRNSFSATLSQASTVEVRKDGEPVKGTKAERGQVKGYTYHSRKASKDVDGWAT